MGNGIGNGKNNSQYSVSTLHHYFDDVLVPIAKFATDKTISIKQILENSSNLIDFINAENQSLTILKNKEIEEKLASYEKK